jgi:hypothetical protein
MISDKSGDEVAVDYFKVILYSKILFEGLKKCNRG